MKNAAAAASPEAYVASLAGWRRARVEALRASVRAAGKLEEVIKWGHLVYRANGPVCLIRAEDDRVLLGFWRGRRLLELEPRLKPGGKYEMATLELRADTEISAVATRRLVREAVALNVAHGDPTDATPRGKAATKARPATAAGRAREPRADRPGG